MNATSGASEASPSKPSDRLEGCPICLNEEFDNRSKVAGCGHEFCAECIKEWARARRTPCCPLCKNEVDFIFLQDGCKEVVEKGTTNPEEDVTDLSCLDHSYFLGETNRLLHRAQYSQDSFFLDAYGVKRSGREKAEHAYFILGEVINSLKSRREELVQESAFDPEELIQELYSLDRTVQQVKAGTHDFTTTGLNNPAVLYGADDADAVPDDEDDVICEDIDDYSDYCESRRGPNTQRPSKPPYERSRRRR